MAETFNEIYLIIGSFAIVVSWFKFEFKFASLMYVSLYRIEMVALILLCVTFELIWKERNAWNEIARGANGESGCGLPAETKLKCFVCMFLAHKILAIVYNWYAHTQPIHHNQNAEQITLM